MYVKSGEPTNVGCAAYAVLTGKAKVFVKSTNRGSSVLMVSTSQRITSSLYSKDG